MRREYPIKTDGRKAICLKCGESHLNAVSVDFDMYGKLSVQIKCKTCDLFFWMYFFSDETLRVENKEYIKPNRSEMYYVVLGEAEPFDQDEAEEMARENKIEASEGRSHE